MVQESKPALIEDPNDPGTYLIQNSFFVNDSGSEVAPSNGLGLQQTTLKWGDFGSRFFETGVDRGVLYLEGETGVVWNGLISVTESASGGEPTPYYLDGIKYSNQSSPEEFEASIEAYTYPDKFALCDGSAALANGFTVTQQSRKSFGLSYRTRVGNDIDGDTYGYKIHIIYNAMASSSDRNYTSVSGGSEALTFNWNLSTRPMKFSDPAFGVKYGSHVVLDSRVVYPWAMAAVEAVLYGSEGSVSRLPSPQELLTLFVDNALLKIIDNGDGTWTAEGPDSIITMINSGEFEINWPSAVMIDEESYIISSL